MGDFRYIGSFMRKPEGTPAHVVVASRLVPACLTTHGNPELLVMDGTGVVLYAADGYSFLREREVRIHDGDLCLEDRPLLRLEHPGILDLLASEHIGRDGWEIIDYDHMSIDWESLK
ncbi:MAG: hypothetical protein AAB074_13990 [Planctomycetota bacterium]